jgi:hypothetical protein
LGLLTCPDSRPIFYHGFLKHVVVVDLRVSFMLQPWGAWKWTDNMKHTHHPPRASFLSVHLIWYSRRERERERDGVLSSSFHPETQLYNKNRLKNLYYCWKLHSSSTQQGSLLNCRNEREREEEEKKQSSGGGVFSPRRV